MRFPYIYEIMDGEKPVKRYKNWLACKRWAIANLPADPRITIRGFNATTGNPTNYLARRTLTMDWHGAFQLEHGHHYPVPQQEGIPI